MIRRIAIASMVLFGAAACAASVTRDEPADDGVETAEEAVKPFPPAGPKTPATGVRVHPARPSLHRPIPECLPAYADCTSGAVDCCPGTFCPQLAYARARCQPVLENGSFCEEDAQCASGICHQNQCVAEIPECTPIGEPCGGSSCCEGYCLWTGYAIGICAALRLDGDLCQDGAECHSGLCELGVCRSPNCFAPEAYCAATSDCCTGFCTQVPWSYAPGVCLDAQPVGAYCEDGSWCQSGVCSEEFVCTN